MVSSPFVDDSNGIRCIAVPVELALCWMHVIDESAEPLKSQPLEQGAG
jgi:hypothetical protein